MKLALGSFGLVIVDSTLPPQVKFTVNHNPFKELAGFLNFCHNSVRKTQIVEDGAVAISTTASLDFASHAITIHLL